MTDFITEHPYLDLRPILECCRHRRHPLFEKLEVIDRAARVFDFVFQLEFDRLQTEALNYLPVQSLQNSVLKTARVQWILTFRQKHSQSVCARLHDMPDKVLVVSGTVQ